MKIHYFPDTTVYDGEWHDDEKHGEGIFVDFSTGRTMKGVWLNDVLRCSTLMDCPRLLTEMSVVRKYL